VQSHLSILQKRKMSKKPGVGLPQFLHVAGAKDRISDRRAEKNKMGKDRALVESSRKPKKPQLGVRKGGIEIVLLQGKHLTLAQVEVQPQKSALLLQQSQHHKNVRNASSESAIVQEPLVESELGAPRSNPLDQNVQNQAEEHRPQRISLLHTHARTKSATSIEKQRLSTVTPLHPRKKIREVSTNLLKERSTRDGVESVAKVHLQHHEVPIHPPVRSKNVPHLVDDVLSTTRLSHTSLMSTESVPNASLEKSAGALGSQATKDVASSDGANVRFPLGQRSETSARSVVTNLVYCFTREQQVDHTTKRVQHRVGQVCFSGIEKMLNSKTGPISPHLLGKRGESAMEIEIRTELKRSSRDRVNRLRGIRLRVLGLQLLECGIRVRSEARRREHSTRLTQPTMSGVQDGSLKSTLRVSRTRLERRIRSARASPQPLEVTPLPAVTEFRNGLVVTPIAFATTLGNNENTLGKHEQASPGLHSLLRHDVLQRLPENTTPRLSMNSWDKSQRGSIGGEHFIQ